MFTALVMTAIYRGHIRSRATVLKPSLLLFYDLMCCLVWVFLVIPIKFWMIQQCIVHIPFQITDTYMSGNSLTRCSGNFVGWFWCEPWYYLDVYSIHACCNHLLPRCILYPYIASSSCQVLNYGAVNQAPWRHSFDGIRTRNLVITGPVS